MIGHTFRFGIDEMLDLEIDDLVFWLERAQWINSNGGQQT